MCRHTLVKQIDALYQTMVKDLKDQMSKHDHICITADLWTGDNRGDTYMMSTKCWVFLKFPPTVVDCLFQNLMHCVPAKFGHF